MRKSGIYQYYVEGEDERSLLNTLKLDLRCIESGKIDKFNVIQSRFTTARMRTLKTGTTVVPVMCHQRLLRTVCWTEILHQISSIHWRRRSIRRLRVSIRSSSGLWTAAGIQCI